MPVNENEGRPEFTPRAGANKMSREPKDTAAAGNGQATPGASTEDVFADLDSLRLTQDFDRAKIKKPFTACPLRKPRRHEWFQTRADPAFRFETELFALREELSADWYLPVGRDVLAELDPGSLYACVLFPWINRKAQVSLLPVQLYDSDGRDNDWWTSLREVMAVHAAQGRWIRIAGGNQAYDIEIAENETLPDPVWPDVDLATILRTAFKGGRLIDRLDHPVIMANLRGRI